METLIFVVALLSNYLNGYLDINVPDHKKVFDDKLYDDALDSEMCLQQIEYLRNNNTNLLLRFIDSSFRVPKGLLDGNLIDYGNYHQCLRINQETAVSTLEGKYCMISVPLSQDLKLPSFPEFSQWPDITWPEIFWPEPNPDTDEKTLKLKSYRQLGSNGIMPTKEMSRVAADSPLADMKLLLAICVPKACTTQQAISELLFNVTPAEFEYDDAFCRLPGDKRWVAADYAFIAVFSFLGFLVILSTSYDLYQTVILKNDSKHLSKLLLSFSVYTNTRRLVTYNAVPGSIECLDGVRSLAMMWIILYHTYINQIQVPLANPFDLFNTSPFATIWVLIGSYMVDTFFLLSGLLLVYTTAGKLTKSNLIKNLHLFYLNRLLRIFPLLAAYVLIQASLLNWVADGPFWAVIAAQVQRCRVYWWSTLLYVQNWVNPSNTCLSHSWFLAVDMQLYILSPIFLFWVLGTSKRAGWVSLSAGLILSLAGASVYNFIHDFQSAAVMLSRPAEDQQYYMEYYYVNTLTRSSPFFVGMIYGYLLHLYRGKKLRISKFLVIVMWATAVALLAIIAGVTYPLMQVEWNNQLLDNVINSYMRPAWALAIGWVVVACAKGYGGPVNWVLSLRCFKVLSRLSFAMYIVHSPLIFLVNSTKMNPGYFELQTSLYMFLADFSLAVIVAYLLTMLVDAPCSTLIKLLMGGLGSLPPPKVKEVQVDNIPQ